MLRALGERRIGLIQLEWNEKSTAALAADRRPVARLLAGYGYLLYRPGPAGDLAPVTDPGFGADFFVRPATEAVDNVNWYLLCQSKAPNSRTAALGPKTPTWAEVAAELAEWRTIWTTCVVWDTAIFIKPLAMFPGPSTRPLPRPSARPWPACSVAPWKRAPVRRMAVPS